MARTMVPVQGGKALGVREALSRLVGHLPYGESAGKVGRLPGIHTCTSNAENHAEAWGEQGIAENPYYRWRRKYDGATMSPIHRATAP